MRLVLKITPIAILLFGVAACGPPAGKPTLEEMQSMIAKELPVGSDTKTIKLFFSRHHLAYGYDRFTNKYDGIVRYDRFSGITIDISLDENGAVKSSDVEAYATMP